MKYEVLDRGNGRILLRGQFDETTVGEAMLAGEELFSKYREISVDLAEVDCANTASLAMLVEWSMWAGTKDRTIVYENVPAGLMAIAKVNFVDQILQIDAG